jgi:hypothetical protein
MLLMLIVMLGLNKLIIWAVNRSATRSPKYPCTSRAAGEEASPEGRPHEGQMGIGRRLPRRPAAYASTRQDAASEVTAISS